MNPSLNTFTAIVKQYHPLLHRYAACIIKNEQQAETIATKALVQCWNNRTQLNTTDEIKKFSKTKTKTLCHQWLQTNALHIRQHQIADHSAPPSPKGEGSGDEVNY